MLYNQELAVAKEAVNAASEVMESYIREGFSVSLKGKNDLVTEADLACEKVIIETIKKTFPDDEFLAEESSQTTTLSNKRIWIIDPIDGTTNFAHQFPVYCSSIGFWENKTPKVGVVYQAGSNELFHAVEGKGAYLNGDPISVSKIKKLENALLGTGFPYKNFDLSDHYLDLFRTLLGKCHGIRRPGAASYDLCCVAAGRFDGFYEHGLSPWDIAAGALIIKEAGGIISDWNEGENWLFGQRCIAGNPHIHSQLLDEIHIHFETEELTQKS